ncbi:MAG: DoxX family protein [Capnocytophaga sp.]|nr:DoxX family protein [Capnocytophaga sp.]
MKKNTDLGLLILRLAVGVLFLLHGIAKIGHLEGVQYLLSEKGLPAFISYGVLVGEVLAPILLIIGYRTRLAAVVVMFTALAAIWLAHSHEIFALSQHGGWAIELLGLYLFGAKALFFTGGGRLAVSTKNRWD